jgi:amino-acid N-acetyltransferase
MSAAFLLFSNAVKVTAATQNDLSAIKTLLEANHLPTAGVDEHWSAFVVARDGEAIAGCGGLELYPDAALIRSIAVDADYRSRGIGDLIVRALVDRIGKRDLYLLTTTAEKYFARRGFEKIARDSVHPQLSASREFQDACPASAIAMRRVTAA